MLQTPLEQWAFSEHGVPVRPTQTLLALQVEPTAQGSPSATLHPLHVPPLEQWLLVHWVFTVQVELVPFASTHSPPNTFEHWFEPPPQLPVEPHVAQTLLPLQ